MNRLTTLPRVLLVPAPTPLHPAPRLSEELGVEVWFKRDDLTGVGLGGNKIRALEYLVGDALALGTDCLVTGAGPGSNWAMLAALVARRSGLDPYLIYYGAPTRPAGNHLLACRSGADVRFTGNPARESVDTAIAEVTAELRTSGRRPYPLPRGGATALGSVGYVRASLELAAQLVERDLTPRTLWLPVGSCGTLAGLVAGAHWLGTTYQITGVTVSRPVAECVTRAETLAAEAADLLHLPEPVLAGEIRNGLAHSGYGESSPEGDRAARLVARTEGVLLDPVFGAKAMAALVEAAERGRVADPVVFLVTGGAGTLFGTAGESA